jgi:prepilin-type processing-associated H-X9-DG protein
VAERIYCRDNLKVIGLASSLYAMDHDGVFPGSLQDLYPEYHDCLPYWACPTTHATPGDPDEIDGWSDYVLVPGRTENDERNTILAYCRGGQHGTRGVPVLFVDGRVEWVRARDFEKLMS